MSDSHRKTYLSFQLFPNFVSVGQKPSPELQLKSLHRQYFVLIILSQEDKIRL